jgi:hypothetical protein
MKFRRQRGFALLILAALVVAGTAWFFVNTLAASANRLATDRARNGATLQEAKQALIAYVLQQAALSSEHNPGRFPCPEAAGYFGDMTQEGVAAGTCSLPKIGRLPWKTLGIEKLLDADGEPLWYIISPGWANDGAALSINSDSVGMLGVDGKSNSAIALIVAPGAPLSVQSSGTCNARTQSRRTTDNSGALIAPDYRDFLECDNASFPADNSFATLGPSGSFNDQVVAITISDVMPLLEGVITSRIAKDVIPQFSSIYSSASWGASTSTPIFPFAANFQDPASSTFKGVAGKSQGLLPLHATTCTTMTAGRCDDNPLSPFITWDLSSIAVTKSGGTASSISASCPASTSTSILCTITFSRSSCFICSITVSGVALQAKATNVGMTFKTLTTAGLSGLSGTITLTSPLQSDGSALAKYSSSTTYSGGSGGLCGTFFGLSCTGTISNVAMPISIFQGHPFLNPSSSDAWYWFFANKWHHYTYYAVAQSHLPSGATHNCATVGDCILISGMTPSTGIRASTALTGRNLMSTSRLYDDITGFMDSAENRNGDRSFEQLRVSRTFNDRFVSVSNY